MPPSSSSSEPPPSKRDAPARNSTDRNGLRQAARAAYGIVPNFFKVMADHTEMPGAVYMAADASLMNGVLRPPEQQAVLLDMARYHNCRYDAIVHTRMGLDAGLPPDIIDAILAGDVPEHERYGALVEAARVTCEQRGWLNQDTLQGLQSRSVGYGELYEIFALIGMKTFSAYTHHMAGTDVDGPLQATEDAMSTVPEKPDSVRRQRLFLG